MSFPAWFDLHKDRAISKHPTAYRVYAYLLEDPKCHWVVQEPKAWLIAEQREMSPNSVNDALDLLIRRGYLIDHGRGQNNVRRVTVALTRAA